MEDPAHRPEPWLKVSEIIEEERNISTMWGEELVATDLGVQYIQRQEERIRLVKKTEIEAR